MRLRGVRPPAARRPPLRRGRRHRPAARRARRASASTPPSSPGCADSGVVDAATLDWLADYRFTGDVDGYARGRAVLPRLAGAPVEGTFAEAVAAGDRSCCRSSTTTAPIASAAAPDDDAPPAPAVPRDGLAPHPRAGRRRGGPGGLRRPASPRRRISRPAGATGSRPRARPRTRSPCCTTTRRAAFAAQVAALGPGHDPARRHLRRRGGRAHRGRGRRDRARRRPARLRRPRRAGARRCARSSTRSAPPVPGSWSPATSTSTRSPRSPPPRSTPTASAPRWSPAPGRPTAGLVYKLVEVDGRPVAKRSRARPRRRPQGGGAAAPCDRHSGGGGRGRPAHPAGPGARPRAAAPAAARRGARRRPAEPARSPATTCGPRWCRCPGTA